MDAKKCDACGKLYENYGNKTTDYNTMFLLAVSDRCSERGRKRYDLCSECMDKVLGVLKVGEKNEKGV